MRLLPAVLCLLLLFTSQAASQEEEGSLVVRESPIKLEGPPIVSQYFDVTGRKAILMGFEGGEMEAWVYPFKIADKIRLRFDRPDFAEPASSESLARWITVRPDSTTILFSHDRFSVEATAFVPLDEQAIVIMLEVDSSEPLTISLTFQPVLRPMWPAGFGGQYSYWNEECRAFLVSESRRRYSALIGSPRATAYFSTPAHRLSETPNRLDIELERPSELEGPIPIVIAGAKEREEAIATYNHVIANLQALYEERAAHSRKLHDDFLRFKTPDEAFDLAFEWGKAALDDGMVDNPDLGLGLVAGFGMSGRSERPGFAWYFGGDTFYNQYSLTAYGDFAAARAALELIRRNQRADGKIMHELSQGAAYIDWFGDYPYGYYHMETSSYYIVAAWNYVRRSGDVEFLRESWPSILKAFRFAKTIVDPDDGLPDGRKGGLGALEVGVLLKDLKVDIYVAGLWVESMRCLARAAELMGDTEAPAELEPLLDKAERSLRERYFIKEQGFHALALAVDGAAISELTAWPAMPMMFELLEEEEALSTLRCLAAPEIATDYGIRMLTGRSEKYDPTHYNAGAVWPFLTGYVAKAQYRYHRPQAGRQLLQGLAGLAFEDSRGDIAELYSGDFHRPLEPAVPHQLFSTGGFVAPAVEGLLGYLPDIARKKVTWAPQIPVEWEHLEAANVPLEGRKLTLRFHRGESSFTYSIAGFSGDYELEFQPSFPVGTEIEGVLVNGEAVEFEVAGKRCAEVLSCRAPLRGDVTIEVAFRRYLGLVLPPPPSKPGERSGALRYLDSWRDCDGTIYYELSGRSGRDYKLELIALGSALPADGTTERVSDIIVSLPGRKGAEYQRVLLAIRNGKPEVIYNPA